MEAIEELPTATTSTTSSSSSSAYINATKRVELNNKAKQIVTESSQACFRKEFLFPQDELAPSFWLFSLPDFIEMLHPKLLKPSLTNPHMRTTLLINTGLWESDIYKEHVMRRVIDGSNAVADQFIWKTTTHNKCVGITKQAAWYSHDEDLCKKEGVDCMNLSWTRLIGNMSWDCHHFTQPLYNLINDQMIDLLSH